MIETDYSVKLPSHRPDKDGISRKRPVYGQTLGLRLSHCRRDDPLFLVAKRTVLTGMGVEAGDG